MVRQAPGQFRQWINARQRYSGPVVCSAAALRLSPALLQLPEAEKPREARLFRAASQDVKIQQNRQVSLAEDAVSSEPVSARKFPVLQGKYREFGNFRPGSPSRGRKKAKDRAAIGGKFPAPRNREFFQRCREKNPLMREIAPRIREADASRAPHARAADG